MAKLEREVVRQTTWEGTDAARRVLNERYLIKQDGKAVETPEQLFMRVSRSIAQIEANPFQPRSHFEETALQELADSIKVHGIIQPVTVRKMGYDRYQLISGERRFRASQLAGIEQIPAYIRVANDQIGKLDYRIRPGEAVIVTIDGGRRMMKIASIPYQWRTAVGGNEANRLFLQTNSSIHNHVIVSR